MISEVFIFPSALLQSVAVNPSSSLAPLHFALMQINAIKPANTNLFLFFFPFCPVLLLLLQM